MNSQIVNEYLELIGGFLLYLTFKLSVFLHFKFFWVLSNLFGYRICCQQINFCLSVQGKMREGQGKVRELCSVNYLASLTTLWSYLLHVI